MTTRNPLFPDENASDQPDERPALHARQHTIQPLTNEEKASIGANPAADLIREKLTRLYAQEPDAAAEEREVAAVQPRSKHQQYMYDLSTSGKSLADIQTEWHNYYVNLPDDEKHQVWQEFYENNQPQEHSTRKPDRQAVMQPQAKQVVTEQNQRSAEQRVVVAEHLPSQPAEKRSERDIRKAIRQQVSDRTSKLSPGAKQNFNSLLFGLGTGLIVLIIFLFGFFNEVVIAPFIQPGRSSATPIIVTSSSVDASTSSVIIPKINVQIPVVYNAPSNEESVIENALESGVVHYPSTKLPGQQGNAAIFGHSSNNIFNKGKYKFAFVLLHKLQKEDVFYLTYNGVVYSYKVIDTKVVPPTQVDVLNDIPGQSATATLITCDPPGTSLNRLVVVGQQVSPDPASNSQAASSAPATSASPDANLAGNGPSLWSRLWQSIF